MNFLAHFHLSSDSEEILVGNFLAEFVTRDQTASFPETVRQGVLLHRQIDTFTDRHDQVKKSKKILWPRHRHYSSVIVDIFYDHFLAKNWRQYSEDSLEEFAGSVYSTLRRYDGLFPERGKRALFYMQNNNSLVRYRDLEGIERTMAGMANRARFPSKMARATEDLCLHYETFESSFTTFFPELVDHCLLLSG